MQQWFISILEIPTRALVIYWEKALTEYLSFFPVDYQGIAIKPWALTKKLVIFWESEYFLRARRNYVYAGLLLHPILEIAASNIGVPLTQKLAIFW